jgi:predicted GIY-YIG superfamily endonuclease
MGPRKLTYELCKEVISKYETYTELYKNDISIIMKVKQKKWDELLSHFGPIYSNKNPKWTYERCKEEVSKFTYLSELQGTSVSHALVREGWFDELTSHLIRTQRKPYTIEEVLNESIKYKTRDNFRVGSAGAYNAAKRLNIMLEATKHMGKSPNEKQYTKEETLESARRYKYQRDWKNSERSIYNSAKAYDNPNNPEKREFWLECISHMDYIYKPNGYWTYERCVEISKKFKTRKDFREDSEFGVVYDRIKINKWDELLSHLEYLRKPKGYWTYEKCKEVALKYEYLSDFYNEYGTALIKIRKNKWTELISHLKHKSTNQSRYIYAFEFPDNHVYVGLTYNLEKRLSDHLTTKRAKSPVLAHKEKTGLDFVYKKVYEEKFHKDIAGEMENRAMVYYKNNGWVLLNKAKAGGLGSDKIKWSYEKIKQVLNDVKTLTEARNILPQHVFTVIRKKGWWDDFITPLVNDTGRVKWTVELAMEEIKKYKTRREIQLNANGLYKFLSANDLLKHIPTVDSWFNTIKVKDMFTKEEVYEFFLQFNSGEKARKNNHSYYTCAKENNWLKDITRLLKEKRGPVKIKKRKGVPTIQYTKEMCIERALNYIHKSEFTKENGGMYSACIKNGWWEDVSKHMVKKPNRVETYTHEKVKELSIGLKHRSEFQEKYSGAFKYASKHGLLDELFPVKHPNHETPFLWDFEKCKEVASKYEKISHLRKDYPGASKAIKKYGWDKILFPYLSEQTKQLELI